jgi:two-component system sensor histidine kinase VicK
MTDEINRKITVIAVSSALLALVFVIVTPNLYMTALPELQFFSGSYFIKSFLLLAVIVGLLLFVIQMSLKTIHIHFEEQQNSINEKHAREIDFHLNALSSHSIVSITNAKGEFTEVNPRFEETFGYSKEELLGQKPGIIYPDRELNPAHLSIKKAMFENRVWTGEEKLRTKTGETVYVSTSIIPKFDDDGIHVENIALRTDLTSSRIAEADRFLTMILEELQDEVYIFDAETLNIKYVNRSARERCDWMDEDVRTKSIIETAPNFTEAMFRDHVADLVQNKVQVTSIEAYHPKGPVEITTRSINGPNDRRLFVSVLRDASVRKQVEKAKMQSVSVVSHELRSPLTSIKGSLRLLQSGVLGKLDGKVASILDIAARNSDRLLLVVNDILDLEKMQANNLPFELTEVDLNVLLAEAVKINAGFADEHAVTFSLILSKERAMCMGDANRLMQAVTNLMSNAVKFSPRGGVVTVGIARRAGGWRVSVRDTGPGIPEDGRKVLFKSFSQLAPVDGKTRKGTGLGLVITKNILKHHTSVIDFSSEIGVGTKFFFDIAALKPSELDAPLTMLSKAS